MVEKLKTIDPVDVLLLIGVTLISYGAAIWIHPGAGLMLCGIMAVAGVALAKSVVTEDADGAS